MTSPTLISGPAQKLTKQNVTDYYADPHVRSSLLRNVGSNPILTVMQREPGKPIYRRQAALDPELLDKLVSQRTTEFHPTLGTKTDVLWVDLDPGKQIPALQLKSVAKQVESTLQKLPGVVSTEISFSGGRGYYVRARLREPMPTNEGRKLLEKNLQPLLQSSDSLVMRPPKDTQIRLDISTLHHKGSIRSPYSLNSSTGLVSIPVPREKLDIFEPIQDATPAAVMAQKDIGEFAPGIPRARAIQTIPDATGKTWTMAVQKHVADRAGPHWDLRLVDPETGYAHSWAVPKATFPDKKPRLALQMPTHTSNYALGFGAKGPEEIREGYGKGTVRIEHKEPIQLLSAGRDKVVFSRDNGDTLSLRRTADNRWLFRKAASMKTAFILGYEAAMEKLGAAALGMRGSQRLPPSASKQPLEIEDKNLPAGQMASMLQGLGNPTNKRTAQKASTNFQNDIDWSAPMEVANFTGSSPLFSAKG